MRAKGKGGGRVLLFRKFRVDINNNNDDDDDSDLEEGESSKVPSKGKC